VNVSRAVRIASQCCLLLGVLSLVLSSVTGVPVFLSYVETGSMEPTLQPGDGFVSVPKAVSGPIQEGDVVVFRSESVQDGRLTTHRVVEVTDRGLVTKGDANPFTDQASGEPPVKRAEVVATAMTVDGHVFVVPGVGFVVERARGAVGTGQQTVAAVLGTRSLLGGRGLAYLFFALTLAWYGVGVLRQREAKRRERTRSRDDGIDVRRAVAAFAALIVLGATASMVVPAGTHEYGVVSSSFESAQPYVVPAGESERHSYVVDNGGVLPVVAFVEPASDGVSVAGGEFVVPSRGTAAASVTLHAPPETGYYRRYVTEHRYLAVLPLSTIRALHSVHPWTPILVIDALLATVFYALGVALTGHERVRRRVREDPQSVYTRVRGLITKLY